MDRFCVHLLDEFGNYIGPDIDSDESVSDDDEDEPEQVADESPGDTMVSLRETFTCESINQIKLEYSPFLLFFFFFLFFNLNGLCLSFL